MVGLVTTRSAAGVASALHVLGSHAVSRSAKNIAARRVLADTHGFFSSFVTNFGWLRRRGLVNGEVFSPLPSRRCWLQPRLAAVFAETAMARRGLGASV